jgi:hypothetical protein
VTAKPISRSKNEDGAGVVGGGATDVTMLQAWVAVPAALSRTLATKEILPAALGVPVMAPVAGLRFKPAGSAPVVENVYGGVPPVATIKELYSTPIYPTLDGQVTDSVPGGLPTVDGPGLTIVLVSSVTAPVRAKALPFNAAPVATVMDIR